MEIQIQDQNGPERVFPGHKKPYFLCRPIVIPDSSEQLLLLDRYRFSLLGKNEVIPDQLQKLRSSGQVLHCTYFEAKQMITLLLKDQTMAIFEFNTGELLTEIQTPSILKMKVQQLLPKCVSNFKNKMNKGLPMYVLLNSHQLDFNVFPIDLKERNQEIYVLESPRDGIVLLHRNKRLMLAKPGFVASHFTTSKNDLHCVSTLHQKNGGFEVSCMIFKVDKLQNDLPWVIKFEKTHIRRNVAQRGGQQEICMLDKDFLVATSPISFKTVIALNGPNYYEVLLIDMFKSQTQVDLRVKMRNPPKNCMVTDVYWAPEFLMISFSNGTLSLFDHQGDFLKLGSQSTFNANILDNQEQFRKGSKLNFEQAPKRAGSRQRSLSAGSRQIKEIQELQICQWVFHNENLSLFTGRQLQTFACKTNVIRKGPKKLPVHIRRCKQIGRSWPLVTLCNKVLVDDRLFSQPEKIFLNLVYSLKTIQSMGSNRYSIQAMNQALVQGFNTFMFLLRVQEPILAFNSVLQVKTFLMRQTKLTSDKWTNYPQAVKEINLNVLEKGEVFNFKKETTFSDGNMLDKRKMIKWWAVIILFKAIQSRAQTIWAHKRTKHAHQKLIPEQIAVQNFQSSICHKLLFKVLEHFYCEFNSPAALKQLRRDIVTLFISLEKDKSSALNKQSRQRVKHTRSMILNKFNEPELPLFTINNFLAPLICGRFNLQKAVDLYKEHGIKMSSFEYVLATQILHHVQGDLLRNRGKSSSVRVHLPSYLDLQQRLGVQELAQFKKLKYRSHVVQLSKKDWARFGNPQLDICFHLYCLDEAALQRAANSEGTSQIDDFVLIQKFYSEIKHPMTVNSQEPFAKMIKLFLDKGYSLRPTLATLSYMMTNLKGCFDLETPSIVHQRNIIFSQMRASKGTTKYPKLFQYVIQNYNKVSLSAFQATELPELPLDDSKNLLNTFLLESFTQFATFFNLDIDVNLNALANAPTVIHGLLAAMTLNNKESKHFNMRSNQEVIRSNAAIDQVKTAIWEISIFLWLVNCRFMSAHTQEKSWLIRTLGIEKALLPWRKNASLELSQTIIDKSTISNDDIKIHEIYLDWEDSVKPMSLISRAIVDEQFFRFIKKLPVLISHYHQNNVKKYGELHKKLESRIKANYWSYYQTFKEVYGLKLNYSIKEEKGANEVKLVKRLKKSWFKQDHNQSEFYLNQTGAMMSTLNKSTSILMPQEETSSVIEPRLQTPPKDDRPQSTLQVDISVIEHDTQDQLDANNIEKEIDMLKEVNQSADQQVSILERSISSIKSARQKDDEFATEDAIFQEDIIKAELAVVPVSPPQSLEQKAGILSTVAEEVDSAKNLEQNVGIAEQEEPLNFIASIPSPDKKIIPFEYGSPRIDEKLSGFDESSMKDHLDALQATLSKWPTIHKEGKKRQKSLKEGVRLLERWLWRKMMQIKYQSFYPMKYLNSLCIEREKSRERVKQALASMSEYELSSVGNSTKPTHQNLSTLMTSERTKNTRDFLQRSPLLNRRRQDSYLFNNSDSKGFSPEYSAQFNKIAETEEDHFEDEGTSYMNTSRLGDESNSEHPWAFNVEGFERKNWFLDLNKHVRSLHSKVIRTPESVKKQVRWAKQPSIKQQYFQIKKQRGRSHSPVPESKKLTYDIHQSRILRHIKLLGKNMKSTMLIKPKGTGIVGKFSPKRDIQQNKLGDTHGQRTARFLYFKKQN